MEKEYTGFKSNVSCLWRDGCLFFLENSSVLKEEEQLDFDVRNIKHNGLSD